MNVLHRHGAWLWPVVNLLGWVAVVCATVAAALVVLAISIALDSRDAGLRGGESGARSQ